MMQITENRSVHVDVTLVISASSAMETAWQRLAATESDALLMDHLGMVARAVGGGQAVSRVRVIACRDATMDEQPFDVSPFYAMPQELPALRSFAGRVRLTAGLRKRSTMEGIMRARSGSWTQAALHRHVVVVVTDCGAYLPQEAILRADPGYAALLRRFLPENMPPTLDSLAACWRYRTGTIDPENSLLLILSPDIAPWNELPAMPRMRWLRCHTESIQQCDPFRLLAANIDTIRQGGSRCGR